MPGGREGWSASTRRTTITPPIHRQRPHTSALLRGGADTTFWSEPPAPTVGPPLSARVTQSETVDGCCSEEEKEEEGEALRRPSLRVPFS